MGLIRDNYKRVKSDLYLWHPGAHPQCTSDLMITSVNPKICSYLLPKNSENSKSHSPLYHKIYFHCTVIKQMYKNFYVNYPRKFFETKKILFILEKKNVPEKVNNIDIAKAKVNDERGECLYIFTTIIKQIIHFSHN